MGIRESFENLCEVLKDRKEEVDTLLNNKVDKISGKGLSTNDYTTAEKDKLEGIDVGANKTVVDSSVNSTSTNPVQNKAVMSFVNSSISTNTATFRGTFNSVAELNNYSGTKTNNDYAFVVSKDSAGNTVYNRYKYNGSTWEYEYALNNSSFTAEQWGTINSGLTASDKTSISEKYTKPSSGIPKSDLDADIINSLNKADSAIQDISGKADKSEIVDMVLSEPAIDFDNITEPEYMEVQNEIDELDDDMTALISDVKEYLDINLFNCNNFKSKNTSNWEVMADRKNITITHKNTYSTGYPTAEFKLEPGYYELYFDTSGVISSIMLFEDGVNIADIKNGETFFIDSLKSYQFGIYYASATVQTLSNFVVTKKNTAINTTNKILNLVDTNVSKYDGLLFLDTEIEKGGIDEGMDTTQGHRARTKGFLRFNSDIELIETDIERRFSILYYDDEFNYKSFSGWITDKIVIAADTNFRILYALVNEANYPLANLDKFYRSVQIYSKLKKEVDKNETEIDLLNKKTDKINTDLQTTLPVNVIDFTNFTTSNKNNWTLLDATKDSIKIVHNNVYTTGSPVLNLDIPAGKYRFFINYSKSNAMLDLRKNNTYVKTLKSGSVFEIDGTSEYQMMLSTSVSDTYILTEAYLTKYPTEIEKYVLPYYYKNEIEDCITKFAELNPSNFNVVVVSDIHKHYEDFTDEKLRYIVDSIKKISDSLNIDAVLQLGDVCEGGIDVDKDTSISDMSVVADEFLKIQKPVLWAFGNHDNNEYDYNNTGYTEKTISHYITTNNWVNYFGGRFVGKSAYYYKDFPNKKVRVIVANVCDYNDLVNQDGTITIDTPYQEIRVSTEQLNAIASWIDDSPYEKIFVCGHGLDENLLSLLQSKNNGDKKIICYACGHYHNDALENNPTYGFPISAVSCASVSSKEWGYGSTPIASITSWEDKVNPSTNSGTNNTRTYKRAADTITETSFDILSISNDKITKIKFGAGVDREISY